MPLGHGYTIEEQLTGEAKHGGIQVDVYPRFQESVTFIEKSKSKQLDLFKTPAQLRLAQGHCINMNLNYACIYADALRYILTALKGLRLL